MNASVNRTLVQQVYYAARDGYSKMLYFLLSDKPNGTISHVLENKVFDNGQLCTPLIIGAKNGHNSIVRLLLSKFAPSPEQEGTVRFDGHIIEGATGLWCAAAAGHQKVVSTFIEFHADVNHATRSNSTPLRAACFDGRLDIVSFLIENGANVNLSNNFSNTCLMIASYRGHLDVVLHLVSKGADLNDRARCGASALHFAAESGHVAIVKELLESGASFLRNSNGVTPLISAADRSRTDVVAYLICENVCSRSDKIDALEILGASFANDKDSYDIRMAYHFLELSMLERFADGKETIAKKLSEPIEAYQNRVESRTLEQLRSIRDDPNALHMECLVIRERILGLANPEVRTKYFLFSRDVDASGSAAMTPMFPRLLKLASR